MLFAKGVHSLPAKLDHDLTPLVWSHADEQLSMAVGGYRRLLTFQIVAPLCSTYITHIKQGFLFSYITGALISLHTPSFEVLLLL